MARLAHASDRTSRRPPAASTLAPVDDETAQLARKLRANGESLRAIAAKLGYGHQTILAAVRDIDPGQVTGLDGLTRRGLRGHRMPCVWCGERPQRPRSQCCSRRCARQRWRYRTYIATGRIPGLRPDRWADGPPA